MKPGKQLAAGVTLLIKTGMESAITSKTQELNVQAAAQMGAFVVRKEMAMVIAAEAERLTGIVQVEICNAEAM